jgi:hypothetical protein
MKKGDLKRVIKTTTFLIPAIIMFVVVTVWYGNAFLSIEPQTSIIDEIRYWVIYLVISIFVQYVIFVNAKKQISTSEK